MKHLYYMRHGQTVMNIEGKWSGSTDTPLTDKGHEQAKAAAEAIKKQGVKFDAIVCSPLQRAHHTAKHVATAAGYDHDKIQLHNGFVERHFGELEGVADIEASEVYKLDESSIDKYAEVETIADMQKRADEMLQYLHTLPYDTILVVAHGSFGRALRRAVNKEPLHVRGKTIENAEIIKFI